MAGAGPAMTFHAICRTDLPASQSPFRVVVDEVGRELEWANRFLDAQCVSGVARLSFALLRSTAFCISSAGGRASPAWTYCDFRAGQFTESTLVDYVRAQLDEHPKPSPECINNRSSMLRRLFRFHFQQDMPHAPYLIQRNWYRRSPLGYGRGRVPVASADLKMKVPQREIRTLTVEQVELLLAQFPQCARSGDRGLDAAEWFALARSAGAHAGGSAIQPVADSRTRQGIACPSPTPSAGNHSDCRSAI